jgi:hypothetical protein
MSKRPNFDDMSPEDFDAYRPRTENEVAEHERKSKYRSRCRELGLNPMDPANREADEEYQNEYGRDRFDEDELTRRLEDLDKD